MIFFLIFCILTLFHKKWSIDLWKINLIFGPNESELWFMVLDYRIRCHKSLFDQWCGMTLMLRSTYLGRPFSFLCPASHTHLTYIYFSPLFMFVSLQSFKLSLIYWFNKPWIWSLDLQYQSILHLLFNLYTLFWSTLGIFWRSIFR
jgi:hypothetical protein